MSGLMASSLSRLSEGPETSRPWGRGGCFLLLLLLRLLQLNSGYQEFNTISGCGTPWWSEDLEPKRYWPWEVSLQIENEHVCGGALVHPSWVVTAAHCIRSNRRYSVMVGTSELKPKNTSTALSIPVSDIIIHPKYWGQTYITGDIALLQLETPATLSKFVQPICLPKPDYKLQVGTQCWVTGWGQVKRRFLANSTLTPDLQEDQVFIMDNKKCDQIYHKETAMPYIGPLVLENMVCATNYGENLCSEDSGGPLACEVEDYWILAGVLSWEKSCSKAQNPDVYTRITEYSEWIRNQIENGALSGLHPSTWLLLCWLLLPLIGS